MVRRCRNGIRPDRPIPPSDPTPATVTKPPGNWKHLFGAGEGWLGVDALFCLLDASEVTDQTGNPIIAE
jgi:hypothetical protein